LLRNDLTPQFGGNYLPALDEAETLLGLNDFASCALGLLFVSDGKPSDNHASFPGYQKGMWKYQIPYAEILGARMARMASRYGRRLTVDTVAFGQTDEDYSVLEAMASSSSEYGSIANFNQCLELTSASIGNSITSLTKSLTKTKTELTELGGSSQRIVRRFLRESKSCTDDELRPAKGEWLRYLDGTHFNIEEKPLKRELWDSKNERWIPTEPLSPQAAGVAVRKDIFGEGAERIVFR